MKLSTLAFQVLFISIVLQSLPFWTELYYSVGSANTTELAVFGNSGNLRFTCTYGGLWCACYSNNRGGCTVGCSPSIYQTLYNQTGCPQKEQFFLVGMELSAL